METSNTNLEQALGFAKYQSTLNQQRSVLKEKFDNDCLLPYNGGLFKITQEWLGGFDLQSRWFLDLNQTPVEVDNPQELFDRARDAYRAALEEYGQNYQALRKQRSVRILAGL